MNNIIHSRSGSGAQDIDSLVAQLRDTDGLIRRGARRRLVDIGRAAVPALEQGLTNPLDHARWEAAKALCEIHAPQAAPALVQRLEDDNFSVRWLAAEALIGLGDYAIVPLLKQLVRRPDSVWLRQGAHHILRASGGGRIDSPLYPVVKALEGVEPILETPVAAESALMHMAAT